VHKIDTAGATANGKFEDKDPSQDINGTIVDDDWLNAVQGELVNFIEQAGITLDKAKKDQLFTALIRHGGKVFPTYTAARAYDFSRLRDGDVVYIAGRSSVGDGGKDRFLWDSSDLSTEVGNDEVTAGEGDGGIYVAPSSDKTGASGALVRQFTGSVLPEWWGAVGDALNDDGNNSTDDTSAFQAASDSLSSFGPRAIFIDPSRAYLIDGDLTLEDRVYIEGPYDEPGNIDGFDYEALGGRLVVNSAATIHCRNSSGVVGCVIERKGLDTPFSDASAAQTAISNYAGIGVRLEQQESFAKRCLIIGFDQAVLANDPGGQRLRRNRIEDVKFDCRNGIKVEKSGDISRVIRCHGFPFVTADQFTASEDLRTGTGFSFLDVNTQTSCEACFSIGYNIGFRVNGAHTINFMDCNADYRDTALADSNQVRGFLVEGDCRRIGLMGCSVASYWEGIVINTNNIDMEVVRVIGCVCWSQTDKHVNVLSGSAALLNNTFHLGHATATVTGLKAFTNARELYISDNYFENLSAIEVGSAVDKLTVGPNTYVSCTNIAEVQDTLVHRNHGHAFVDAPQVISDDSVFSFQTKNNAKIGVMILTVTPDDAAVIAYDTTTGNVSIIARTGSSIAANNGSLSGTSGTDGNFTVGADSSQTVYLENRKGSQQRVSWSLLAVF